VPGPELAEIDRLVADVIRIRADGRRSRSGAERSMATLAALAAVESSVQRRIEDAVAAGREQGSSWARVGEALGMSRQAAHERFARRLSVRARTRLP
jgi:hypothetical protein